MLASLRFGRGPRMSFTRACGVGDVAPGQAIAVDDECSHAAIPLSEGDVEGCEIECWLHGSRFDLRTGKPTGPPATEPVAVYPVKVDGDDVLVDVAAPLND